MPTPDLKDLFQNPLSFSQKRQEPCQLGLPEPICLASGPVRPVLIVRPESKVRVRQLESDEGDPLTPDRQHPALGPIPDDRSCPGVPMSTTAVYTSARGSNFPSIIMPKTPLWSVSHYTFRYDIFWYRTASGPLSEDDTGAGPHSVLSPAGEVRAMAISRTQSPGPGRRNLVVYGIGADGIGNAPFIEMQSRAPGNHDLAAWLLAPWCPGTCLLWH